MNLSKEYKKDIKVFLKNIETVKAILSLCDASESNTEINSLELDENIYKVISGLEDKDVKVNYKGKLKDLDNVISNMYKEYKEKYKSLGEDKTSIFELDIDFNEENNDEYNFMELINNLYVITEWNKVVAASKIPVKTKTEMIYDYFKSSNGYLVSNVFDTKKPITIYPVDEEGTTRQEKLKSYISSSNIFKDKCFKNVKTMFLRDLQHSNIINFSSKKRVKELLNERERLSYDDLALLYLMINDEEYSDSVTQAEKDKIIISIINKTYDQYLDCILNYISYNNSYEVIDTYLEKLTNVNQNEVSYNVEDLLKKVKQITNIKLNFDNETKLKTEAMKYSKKRRLERAIRKSRSA